VEVADLSSLDLLLANSVSGSLKNDEEVHSENTSVRIVLHSQIDVLFNTETEASSVGEVSLVKLELLNLEGSLENFLGSVSSEGDVSSNLITSSDTERSNGESALGENWLLAVGQILNNNSAMYLQDLCCLVNLVTRLTDGAVDDELLDSDVSHRVLLILLGIFLRHFERFIMQINVN
jgi:hypothetical protein